MGFKTVCWGGTQPSPDIAGTTGPTNTPDEKTPDENAGLGGVLDFPLSDVSANQARR